MAKRERVVRMSVEQPLWRALTGYRVLTMVYAVLLFAFGRERYERPWVALLYLAFLCVWTLATLPKVANAASCTKRFLVADLTVALVGILLTPLADAQAQSVDHSTLPTIWTAGSVLAYAIKGGWRWAGVASSLVAVANLVERGHPSRDTLHNVLLVWVASIAIGYVVEVARASERTLARALEIEAATRERERLARDIHDGVLQVLAMVQRRGTALGGEAADLGRMAGEQEVALRTLVAGGLNRPSLVSEDESEGAVVRVVDEDEEHDDGPVDLRLLLAPRAGAKVTLSEPGAPVLLAPPAARELAAAVGAALDNVRVHAGSGARAWILVEDWPDEVIVTVRDDGPGIPEGRLAQAEGEGRMGVALSIRGRLRDLGGTAELISVPGQGTEVELKVPRGKAGQGR
ncbi:MULTISPECIES: MacS family sensor histidine kinase [unclassified Streptomyces]|uniref:MacS family sensor histidine kinase n=1 Tax=unclassified Streptomyces TaxID=2593676 RepID=UPI0036F80642